ERARREREQLAQQEAKEQARRLREQAIAGGRQAAAARWSEGNLEEAVGLLERLRGQYPDSVEVHRDYDAAAQELRERQETEERARREREQTIAAGRLTAATQELKGNLQEALAL